MQHPFFAPLDDQRLTLLLITLTVGGKEQVGLFKFLPEQVGQALTEKALALQQIAADVRVPLMVRELTAALERNGQRGVERLDPSWIVHGLKGESPRLVGSILLNLPAPLVRSVLRRLPPAVRDHLPPKSQLSRIAPALSRHLRILFESRFAPMPLRHGEGFAFVDIIHLERGELFLLIRDLGLTELGQAFVAVGKMALVELCRRLPRAHADELIHAVKSASQADLPDPKTAQRFLSRVVVNFQNTEEFLHKAGLWRLAKALRGTDPSFWVTLGQRLPRRTAHFLRAYVDKAGEMEDLSQEVQQRLHDGVLVRIVSLARAGSIGEAYAKLKMDYHDPGAAEAALSQNESKPGPESKPELDRG
jgi:hypothetical protein